MSTFRRYRRTAIAEMADWHPGFAMTGVSISEADQAAGSPKPGDKIARNPDNHADQWLVAAGYFTANFDPVPLTMNSEPFPMNYIELRTVSAEMSVNCRPCILLSMQRSAEFYVLRLAPHLNDHDVMPACSEHAEQAVQAYIRGLRR